MLPPRTRLTHTVFMSAFRACAAYGRHHCLQHKQAVVTIQTETVNSKTEYIDIISNYNRHNTALSSSSSSTTVGSMPVGV